MSQYYISKVRAKSFKSIGDEWLEITLNKGVNAIVGASIPLHIFLYTSMILMRKKLRSKTLNCFCLHLM